jgi:hypothetical protein
MIPSAPSSVPAEQSGIIGTRQLVAVQTIDIARLTAQPVGIVPETFVAVTGRGPIDSNESGKTSFLSAVSLLLGDPEWRVTGTGAASVAALLFEPITAGAQLGVNAATEGFIVGIFADPDNPLGTAHTVWMRISSGRPHILVRHAPGVQLARGVDSTEIGLAAPGIYKSLGGEPLGSTEYARVLYGRSPRVLAYVASRGQVRSRPSLLKLDAGTFAPEQIGDALIALTGRATLFDRDHQDRRDLAAKQGELAEHIQRDAEHRAREGKILDQVRARNELREQLESVSLHLSRSRARATLDAYARSESAAAVLEQSGPARQKLSEKLGELLEAHSGLLDKEAMEEAVRQSQADRDKAEQAYAAALRYEGGLQHTLIQLEQELAETRVLAADHDITVDGSVIDCESQRDAATLELSALGRSIEMQQTEVGRLEERLKQALDGQFGPAGQAIRVLASAQIPAVSLAEATRLEGSRRPVWESRLFPWRDAVCVASENLTRALAALAEMPGAIIVSQPDGPSPAPGVEDAGQASPLPAGVLEAPAEAIYFLWKLADQPAADQPVPHTVDMALGVHVVGGFSTPIVGGEELRLSLIERLTEARQQLESSKKRRQGLAATAERAATIVDHAKAAERLSQLRPQVEQHAAALAKHQAHVIPRLSSEQTEKSQKHVQATTAINEREDALNRLASEMTETRAHMRTLDAEMERLRLASHPDDKVLAAWGLGRNAALQALGWPEGLPSGTGDQLREEATPPPIDTPGHTTERRGATLLAEAARGQLQMALGALSQHADGLGGPSAELKLAAKRYSETQYVGDDDAAGTKFETLLTSLQAWLDDEYERDAAAPEQAALASRERASKTEYVTSETLRLQHALDMTQEAIKQRASGALEAIGSALDKLNRGSGGLGAELAYEIEPPPAPDQSWTCQVTPKWRRNPGGPVLPYDNVTNTAQEKLFSIHLVLAALLAAPHPRGRVLILDELGDSLGAEHRKEVLAAIASVAKNHGITILATCQDTIMLEARPFTKQILYFHYPSRSTSLNRPTRMFGVDPNGARVELTADALIEGRTLF